MFIVIQPCVFHGHTRADLGDLSTASHAPGFFEIEILLRVKIDFARDLNFQVARIKPG
jgi:hypothetical protein